MLIADLNEFVYFTNAAAYAAGHAPDGTPYQAVILRATYSTGHVDNRYAANLAQARAAGVLCGHYGYMAKTDDPAAFGRFLAQTIAANGGLRPGESIWVDDEETLGGPESPRIAAALAAAHAILNDPVADEGEYSGDAFFHAHIGQRVQANGVVTHLWVASYGTAAPADGEDLFQFTDKQSMPGVSAPCDCSIFNGTLDQLKALFGATAAPAPAPAPTSASPGSVSYPTPLRLQPVAASLAWPHGGALLLGVDGSVYAFGGAPFLGGAAGQAYFAGRTAARLIYRAAVAGGYGEGYTIVDTAGEKYNYDGHHG